MIDWDCVLRENGPAVWRTTFRLLGNRADADECFQETFLAAIRWTQQQTAPVSQWKALLVRLATARAVDRLRQRIRRSSREAPGVDPQCSPDQDMNSRPPERAQQAELSARLRLVLAHLPLKQADAFCLHCLEGWTYKQVADHMGTSTDNVGTLVHRARAALKQRIASILSHESPDPGQSPFDVPHSHNDDEVTHDQ